MSAVAAQLENSMMKVTNNCLLEDVRGLIPFGAFSHAFEGPPS
jgi:hypothetical protein